MDTVTVDLVKNITTNMEYLSTVFLYSPALSITCQLHDLQPWSGMEWQQDQFRTMINRILAMLLRRGGPVMNNSGHQIAFCKSYDTIER